MCEISYCYTILAFKWNEVKIAKTAAELSDMTLVRIQLDLLE